MGQRIFLDIIDAQDKRALYLNTDNAPILVPSIDPRDLFGNSGASHIDARCGTRFEEPTRNPAGNELGDRSIPPEDNSVFECLLHDQLSWEGAYFKPLVVMY